MREKMHAYLLERPGGATRQELLDLIFTQPGTDPEFGPRFLSTLLAGDPRFAFRPRGSRWVATAHAVVARRLSEASFVVVDLETTGGSPRRGDSIIEIGAVRLAAGRVVDRFARLVNPHRSLPPFITALTGISEAMLADQAGIDAVMPEFLQFAGHDVLIAHNAHFDLSFLNASLRDAELRELTAPHLCTLRLARRLLPNLRRRSLDALAGHLGIPPVSRHRALGDASITAEIFFHFVELLRRHGITLVDQALDFQHQASDGRRFVCLLPRAAVERLPSTPGVYHFIGEGGRLLYIGKAVNLRRRVGSYLSNAAGHSRKTLDLIRHIRAVTAQQTGSELEASLLEAEAIRRCQPPYNARGKHLPRIAFLKLAVTDELPRLSVATRAHGRDARYFGPFRSRAVADSVLDVLSRLFRVRVCRGRLTPHPDVAPCFKGQIGTCSMPCAARVKPSQYREQVAELLRFFAGDGAVSLAYLARRRDEHSAALHFEAAARVQRDIDLVEWLQCRQRQLGWIVDRQHLVVVQPSLDLGRALVYFVVHGRLQERRVVDASTDLRPLAERLGALLDDPEACQLQPHDVDGSAILAAWLRNRGERDGYVFPLTAGARQGNEQQPEWLATLRALVALPRYANPHRSL